jgi:hypothetical protein
MKLIKLTCALLFSTWVSLANATLIFDFSFTNTFNGGGVVTGEILGLNDNAQGPATSVRILTNTFGFGIGEYVGSSNRFPNVFWVDNGQIRYAVFASIGIWNLPPVVVDSSFILTMDVGYSPGPFGLRPMSDEVFSDSLSRQRFSVWQRAVEVPEPGTVILMSLGIAGLLVSQRRKQA